MKRGANEYAHSEIVVKSINRLYYVTDWAAVISP